MQITKHAEERFRQRGLPNWAIELALDLFDLELPAGGGAYAIGLSRRQARRLSNIGVGGQIIDRLKKTALICDASDVVITALSGKPARRTLRNAWKRGH